MVLLTEKQKEKVLLLQNQFSDVHQEIEAVKIEMDRLNEGAEKLVKKLISLREEEHKLISDLELKYGVGKLDPFSMTYQI
jgi:predicted nuclease with TOPRIM domain